MRNKKSGIRNEEVMGNRRVDFVIDGVFANKHNRHTAPTPACFFKQGDRGWQNKIVFELNMLSGMGSNQ